ncbi:GNAT family N-acetyltransferase [Rugamonas sp.]|uniref:GNAT family N-acetyltransferase n=1 Tax=Rugamonas sp. TaxID=1926287 RepID=UPI0025E83134|nr:GNAT family N-acetyltransferase [Rugamonas sp.]
MSSIDLFQNPLGRWFKGGAARPTVRVKELKERDRRRMVKHFLALESRDRLLRFGAIVPDEQVAKYVNGIDFARDMVFGVYNRVFKLVAVGHLAFAPRDASPRKSAATDKERVAEFGVSVAHSMRGMGVGSKLFERAAIHCRNNDIDTLYMHCLSSNATMMHIAKKAGMAIHRDYGEADAYLKLPPPNPGSVLQEAMEEQVAMLDYAYKANKRAAVKWLDRLPGRKSE